ncbi:hypothetical protein BH23THE1_BH23THE1_13550 [soil metagenome]
MTSVEKTIEKDFSLFFRDSIDELNRLNKEESNTQNKKKQVVIEVAKRLELEGKVPIDTICMIVIKNLQDVLKPRSIREYLPEKYKPLHKVNNAKKQKSIQIESISVDNLAAVPPLNREEVVDIDTIVIDTKDKISIEEKEAESIQPFSPVDISMTDADLVTSFESHPTIMSDTPPQQQDPKIVTSITRCGECPKKDIIIDNKDCKILELTEIIEKSNQFTTAEKLVAKKDSDDNKEAMGDIIEFECPKTYREVSEYIKPFFSMGNYVKIYFRVRINATTRKILSFDFGKLDQYRNMNGD